MKNLVRIKGRYMGRLPSCQCGEEHLVLVKRSQGKAWYYHQMCNLCKTLGYFATPKADFSDEQRDNASAVSRVYDRATARYVGRADPPDGG